MMDDMERRLQVCRDEYAAGRMSLEKMERNIEQVLRCAEEGSHWRGVPFGPLDFEASDLGEARMIENDIARVSGGEGGFRTFPASDPYAA